MKSTIMLLILFSSVLVSADMKVKLEKEIRTVAAAAGVDPDLVVAIAKVESSLNPNAMGGLGEVGLFQLRPEYHNVIPGNTKHNTRIAVAFLRSLQTRFADGYGEGWFVLYNYGPGNAPKEPTRTNYYKKVMREIDLMRVNRQLASN